MTRRIIGSALVAVLASATMAVTALAGAAGQATQPSICTRSCWGARAPRSIPSEMAALNRAVIHHTAQPNDWNTNSQAESAALVRAIQNLHMDSNGWADIGYHFLVDKLGNRFEGRYNSINGWPRGAHDNVNTNSFGFNVMGYMHTPYNQSPTTAQRQALYDLIAWKIPNPFTGYGAGTYNGATVGYLCGHRDVGATACPGDLMYQYIGTNVNGGEARNEVNRRIVGTPPVIVDNTDSGFSASTNWFASTSTPGYYGSNYRARATEAVSDQAQWTVTLPADGTYKVYVWYTAGSNRAAAAPYQVTHTGGTTTVNVNQQANGSQWVLLGTWNFYQGTAVRVKLSCWTTAGYYVIADAVKFEKQ
ncbi:MAG: N-acetylmuramoyl-L-alanine amidase [Candidatus Sumerlaeaceae bacterium]|nr:N-acetylmuramoyl-L-alanine amidase [Candidatus Sumerlaeaceae bacterium]